MRDERCVEQARGGGVEARADPTGPLLAMPARTDSRRNRPFARLPLAPRQRHGTIARVVRALVVLLSVLLAQIAQAAGGTGPVSSTHLQVELVADVAAVRPGEPFDAGLRFVLDEGWHVYWSNPGDSGLAPHLRWRLPANGTAGDLQWPQPHRIAIGPLVNYGYEGEVLLPVRVTPPASLRPGDAFTLAARADWLVCREDCIPGQTDLTLDLPVRDAPPARSGWSPLFDATRALLPRAASGLDVAAVQREGRVELRVKSAGGTPVLSADGPASLTFFPADAETIENAAEQVLAPAADGFTLALETSHQRREPVERLRGTLVAAPGFAPDAAPAIAIDVPVQAGGPARDGMAAAPSMVAHAPPPAKAVQLPTDQAAPAAAPLSLWLAVALAVLGGLLLNFMPCVFPVLSIKIFDFVRQASGRPAALRRHGYVYAAGVLLSFWILAGSLLALRAAGQGLGWGFQLQSPAFVVAMIFLLVALALSLLGLFDVGLGLTALAGRVPQGEGLAGSFATGVLATVIATPCTAPFMGPALGFALTLSPPGALLVFSALGAGMAAPYVVLCLVPGWVRLLPRPGAWLETFKQLMAFPLLATALWLLWVLGQQAGVDAMLGTLSGLLVLVLAVWLHGRFARHDRPAGVRRVAQVLALLVACAGLATGLLVRGSDARHVARDAAERDAYGIAWRDYSEQTLATLRAAGTPVFVDFTAAWCLTCKVNEHLVFSSPQVRDAFAAREVAMLRADWTSRDDEITRALASFGRSGVPLYVLYGAAGSEPQVLPSVLTRGVVLDALDRIDKPKEIARR
jgi:thiol:disulfide interchange protein DsbD